MVAPKTCCALRGSLLRIVRWPFACFAEGMRPLPRVDGKKFRTTRSLVVALLAPGAWAVGYGAGGSSAVSPPPPPPLYIVVTVTGPSGPVVLGNTVTFTAAVKNIADTSVNWR